MESYCLASFDLFLFFCFSSLSPGSPESGGFAQVGQSQPTAADWDEVL